MKPALSSLALVTLLAACGTEGDSKKPLLSAEIELSANTPDLQGENSEGTKPGKKKAKTPIEPSGEGLGASARSIAKSTLEPLPKDTPVESLDSPAVETDVAPSVVPSPAPEPTEKIAVLFWQGPRNWYDVGMTSKKVSGRAHMTAYIDLPTSADWNAATANMTSPNCGAAAGDIKAHCVWKPTNCEGFFIEFNTGEKKYIERWAELTFEVKDGVIAVKESKGISAEDKANLLAQGYQAVACSEETWNLRN